MCECRSLSVSRSVPLQSNDLQRSLSERKTCFLLLMSTRVEKEKRLKEGQEGWNLCLHYRPCCRRGTLVLRFFQSLYDLEDSTSVDGSLKNNTLFLFGEKQIRWYSVQKTGNDDSGVDYMFNTEKCRVFRVHPRVVTTRVTSLVFNQSSFYE